MPSRQRNRVNRKRKNKEGLPAYIKQRFFRTDGLNYRRRRKNVDVSDIRKVVVLVVQLIAVVGLAFFLVSSFGIKTTVIGDSMEDALYDGDAVLINKLAVSVFSLDSGDVIVFSPKGNVDASLSCKRVIGVPGDTVRIENGVIYVNDKQYNETKAMAYIEEAGLAESGIKLGKDEYFVMGDNVNYSQDSRYESVGNVKKSDIKGKVWWDLSHFGLIY